MALGSPRRVRTTVLVTPGSSRNIVRGRGVLPSASEDLERVALAVFTNWRLRVAIELNLSILRTLR